MSMVLFSKWNNGIYGTYRGVIDFKNCWWKSLLYCFVDNQLKCFCGCSYAKEEREK